MKEQINYIESKTILLKQLITKLNEINNHWSNLNDSSGKIGENAQSEGMDEHDIRILEKQIAGKLASLDFNINDLSEDDLKVINKYLSVGDCINYQQEIAKKSGMKYKDIFSGEPSYSSMAAEQISKELDKYKKLN